MTRMRLDRFLAKCGEGSRTEVKKLIRAGQVTVDGFVCKDPGFSLDASTALVYVQDRRLHYREHHYLMLNKPAGVVSAARDRLNPTVLDLLPPEYKRLNLFPVGRLDKGTEGLLLLTNDGLLAHRLLDTKRRVPKRYRARVRGEVGEYDRQLFARGIELKDFTALPARLEILEAGAESEVEITVYEGKFHQVKRMFRAVGKEVLYLKRVAMGGLVLDPGLAPGEFRELSREELNLLRKWR